MDTLIQQVRADSLVKVVNLDSPVKVVSQDSLVSLVRTKIAESELSESYKRLELHRLQPFQF